MPRFTKHTRFADLPGLSPSTLKAFADHSFVVLGDMDEVSFDRFAACADSDREMRIIYDAGIKSGAEFILSPEMRLEQVPTVSRRTAQELAAIGFEVLADFEGTFYPDIYEAIGYHRGKPLLLALVLAGVKVTFQKPDWSDDQWRDFVADIVTKGLVSWEDVAVALCGEMNPPQVGTQVASAVKHNYPRGQAMREVWKWLYSQSGRCEVSGKRLFLEADHKRPKEQFIKEGRDPREADTLDNFQLLTKRENVIKRGSHRLGGLSFGPAASVLIYVLLRYRPKNREAFIGICRRHGLTMSEIRMQEAWAFAVWLAKDGQYEIDEGAVEAAIESGPAADDSEEMGDLLV